MHSPLRLRCDGAALTANYGVLCRLAGTETGAAIKADAYGLGVHGVAHKLLQLGCRDFFVSTWAEAADLTFCPPHSVAVLHGLGVDDKPLPLVKPVLISAEQVARWKESDRSGEKCDVMVDTGMNRLGLSPFETDLLGGLNIHTLHSHLSCADEDHPLNRRQLRTFVEVCQAVEAQRYSLANSAGIFLGQDYSFGLVRPGLALYGGIPRPEATNVVKQVVSLQAQVLQTRWVEPGDSVGYNATFITEKRLRIVIINAGYADGYWRSLGKHGRAHHEGAGLPIVGRVSMDLIALDATNSPALGEGDWVDLDFPLQESAAASGYSQYELLTGLGHRWQRYWI